MKSTINLVVASVLALLGCSRGSVAEPDETERPGLALGTTGVAAATINVTRAPAYAGYVHTLPRSRFAIGANIVPVTEYGFTKAVGTQGTFATKANTGLVLALSNADSPARPLPPLAGGRSSHENTTVSYFTGIGIPVEQMGVVKTFPRMSASGQGVVDTGSLALNGHVDGYQTIVHRQYHGVSVAESMAWAQFNVNGDVVSESVYWPELPSEVLLLADSFTSLVADPDAGSVYLATTHAGGAVGQVTIHHTSGVWDGPFQTTVTYDIVVGNRRSHFDTSGNPVMLPDEVEDTTLATPR